MFIEMKVAGITLDPLTKMPIIILKDSKGDNALPIWIGIAEASAIATQIEKIDMARPMTHDLLKTVLDLVSIRVRRIEITEFKNSICFASIYIDHEGKEIPLDARPSDALALSLRADAPIFVAEEILQRARAIRVRRKMESASSQEMGWKEILEGLRPEDFGKYKM